MSDEHNSKTTSAIDANKLAQGCRYVLELNWNGSYTQPAENLYPHQWLWDSCFNVIGWRHFDVERAKTELKSILRGQWSNGMIPNIVFTENSSIIGSDGSHWDSKRSPHSPENLATSGITQPPMLAEAVVKIGEKLDQVARREWYQDVYPAIRDYHLWLYRERDPHNQGLVTILHPWESGMDNSPTWIEQVHKHAKPIWIKLIETGRLDKIFNNLRRDTKFVDPQQRISSIDALIYHNIMLRQKRKNWDSESILMRPFFAVQDVMFNSILARANKHLAAIAEEIGHSLPNELEADIEKTDSAIRKMWDDDFKQYLSKNSNTEKPISTITIGNLMPLYSGSINHKRAEALAQQLYDSELFASEFPVPSVPKNSPYFEAHHYWQGPSWLNTNWLLIEGLEHYGFNKLANHIKQQSLKMVASSGPYEYFSPLDGSPAGAPNFSWTAALTIDLINR